MNCFKIFKRTKPSIRMPEPNFDNNWMQESYEQSVKEGVLALQKGKAIIIYDDGRGYELALEIKRRFMLEYQKQLSENIKIDSFGSEIKVTFEPK